VYSVYYHIDVYREIAIVTVDRRCPLCDGAERK
jgi:hypothetical protein